MDKMSVEQAIQVLALIFESGASREAVQRALIERFDLVETMLHSG